MFSKTTTDELNERISREQHRIKNELDYDTVNFMSISREEKEFLLCFSVDNEFQRKVDTKHWCQNGFLRIKADTDFSKFYSREERELRVLMSQSGEIKALSEDLVSAAGRKFAKALAATRDEISHFLAAPKGTSND